MIERTGFMARGLAVPRSVVERAIALALLVLLSPLIVVIVLAVLIRDGRPVLFVQPRVGKDGRNFGMYKFRTMIPDAIAVGQQLALSEDPFAIVENDPRITRVGGFLRRTSLDELPQLVNVLKGDMSFVGPRPDVPEQVAYYSDDERVRLQVKPGITGWAQINGREGLTWPERFELDRWYLEHRSLRLDLVILMRTLTALSYGREAPVPDDYNIERSRTRAGR